MTLEEKLQILADSAKYDASCSSSGSKRTGQMGCAAVSGICHSFASDGRCISLLKILLTNICIFDCKYCLNRKSNNIKRAIFTPEEICEFLSSGIVKSADYTMNLLIETIYSLRNKYHFSGYIHAKAIPGASPYLVKKLGSLVDRMSANVELATENGLKLLAPNKNSQSVQKIMAYVKENKTKNFVPAGQSTQMIIGASKESDLDILTKSSYLYDNYQLKRVFYSAYIAVNQDKLLPNLKIPPLVRENRLYQADWLLRFYNFKVADILSWQKPNFNLLLDPKCEYALNHLELFPKEINTCSYNDLLKIPGIGVTSAKRIYASRKMFALSFKDLPKMGVVLKRAQYFITCQGKYFQDRSFYRRDYLEHNLVLLENAKETRKVEQLSLF